MAYIRTVLPEEATGLLKEFYDLDVQEDGHVGGTTQAFSLRPEVFSAVLQLLRTIKVAMDPRRYELVTIVAASHLRCTY
jgi:hypothetical protein